MRVVLIVAVVAAAAHFTGGDGVKHIDTKGLNLGEARGDVEKPAVISSAQELAKVFADKNTVDKIKSQVDFGKEKLLYFAWSGSGGDMLIFKSVKTAAGLQVTAMYQAGLTRDLRPHHQFLVIPNNATWKVERVK